MKFVSDFSTAYYLRLSVDDTAGVLAKISGVFGKCGISLIEVSQIAHKNKTFLSDEPNRVPLVIVTHKTTENICKKAVKEIKSLKIGTIESVIRVEQ